MAANAGRQYIIVFRAKYSGIFTKWTKFYRNLGKNVGLSLRKGGNVIGCWLDCWQDARTSKGCQFGCQ